MQKANSLDQIAKHISDKLHPAQFIPGAKSLGELAVIGQSSPMQDNGDQWHNARIYLHAEHVSHNHIVQWLKSGGASRVQVSQVMHDDWNDVADGRAEIDGVRAYDIEFLIPGAGDVQP